MDNINEYYKKFLNIHTNKDDSSTSNTSTHENDNSDEKNKKTDSSDSCSGSNEASSSSNLISTPNIQASFYDNFLLNYNKSAIHDSISEASHDITSATNSSIKNTQGITSSPIENISIVISTLSKGEPSESYSGTPSIHLEDNLDNLNSKYYIDYYKNTHDDSGEDSPNDNEYTTHLSSQNSSKKILDSNSTNTLSDESIIHTNNSSNLIRPPNIQASFYNNFLLNYNKSAIHDSIPEASHDITSATNSSIENTQGIAASPIENTSIVISTLCKGEPSESYSGTPSIHLEDNSDNLNNNLNTSSCIISFTIDDYCDTNTSNSTNSSKGGTGLRGPKGERGVDGMAGPTGPSGLAGSAGLKGEEGLVGPTGERGIMGPTGEKGGAGGPVGPAGPRGEKGVNADYDLTCALRMVYTETDMSIMDSSDIFSDGSYMHIVGNKGMNNITIDDAVVVNNIITYSNTYTAHSICGPRGSTGCTGGTGGTGVIGYKPEFIPDEWHDATSAANILGPGKDVVSGLNLSLIYPFPTQHLAGIAMKELFDGGRLMIAAYFNLTDGVHFYSNTETYPNMGFPNTNNGVIGFMTCMGVHKWVSNTGVTFFGNTDSLNVVGKFQISDELTAQSITMVSDKRLKDNIVKLDADKMIKMTSLIEPVSYNFKTSPAISHYGVIAQQTKKVMPNLVLGNEEKEMLRVNYTELTSIIPLLCQKILKLEEDAQHTKFTDC